MTYIMYRNDTRLGSLAMIKNIIGFFEGYGNEFNQASGRNATPGPKQFALPVPLRWTQHFPHTTQ